MTVSDLFRSAIPFIGPVLVPALLLLLAPLCGRRTRSAFAIVLATLGLGFLVDILVSDHSDVATLAVPNVFPAPPDGEPRLWRVANESAPHWHWHVLAAGLLLFAAAVLWLRRNRPAAAPQPVLHGTAIFLAYFAARLGLEKLAAFEALVWAIGGTNCLLVILPFIGWYCGKRGCSFKKLLGQLTLMAFLQRIPLVAFGYWASTQHGGTHLDTHLVTEFQSPITGTKVFGSDAVRGWTYLTAIPHLTLWIVITVVAGALLGAIPFWIARRKREA